MTETDAYAVMLMRAFESPPLPPWSAEDSTRLTRQAAAHPGTRAQVPTDARDLIVQRARQGLAGLAERLPALGTVLQRGPPTLAPWAGALVLAAAAMIGALGVAVGGATLGGVVGGEPVNLLAPPLLALLVWNLLVYAALLFAVLRGQRAGAGDKRGGRRWLLAHWADAQARLWRRWSGSLAAGTFAADAAPAAAAAARSEALSRFGQAWWRASAPLQAQRLALLLHGAAAALALGAVAALYARGLAVELRAGWASTFLGAEQVRLLLQLLFAPAAALLGSGLPDLAGVAALRLDAAAPPGQGGENAARWIHLIATTVALFVLLPRSALALRAALQLRRLKSDFALPGDDEALSRLLRALRAAQGQAPLPIAVLPYSYQLPPALGDGLSQALDRDFGPGVVLQLAETLPLGAEDELAQWLPQPPPAIVVALFALTATPEAESHGAFLRALAEALTGRARLEVMIDESGFRARFAGDGERLAQRRLAWQRLLQGLSMPGPSSMPRLQANFVDLSRPDGATAEAAATLATQAGPRP